jgi:hypothetical protein
MVWNQFLIRYFEILFCIVCLKTLQKLLESHPDDPKVLFNLALTEYALSSFQRTDVFKNQLNKISEKVMFSLNHSKSNDFSFSFIVN